MPTVSASQVDGVQRHRLPAPCVVARIKDLPAVFVEDRQYRPLYVSERLVEAELTFSFLPSHLSNEKVNFPLRTVWRQLTFCLE